MKSQGVPWEWTILLDKLKELAGKKNEEQTSQIVFHTDQGSVCSSRAYCETHSDYNIVRSMS